MLSMHDVDQYFFEALQGRRGRLRPEVGGRPRPLDACRAALRGEPFLYPPAVRTLIREHLEAPPPARRPTARRSRRASARWSSSIAEAHTTEQIAELLVISPRTVERHRENILDKLGMRDRVELTRYAIRHGLVEP